MGLWLAGLGTFLVLGAMQAAVAAHWAIGGVPPDLVLVGVMIWGYWSGPVRGAVGGVLGGLGIDLSTGGHLGLFALASGLAGWICGEAGLRMDLSHGWMRAVVAAAAAVVYGTVVAAGAHWLLGLAVSEHAAMHHVLIAGLYDGVLTAVGYWPILLLTHNPLPLGTRPITTWRPPATRGGRRPR